MIDTVACAVLTSRQRIRTRLEDVLTTSTQNEQELSRYVQQRTATKQSKSSTVGTLVKRKAE